MNDAFYRELQEDFLRESLSLIERFEFVLLNNTVFSKDLVAELFRIAHSVKGGAAAVGLTEVSKFTHNFEDYLSQFRTSPQLLDSKVVSLLLEFSDLLRNHFLAQLAGLEDVWNPKALLEKILAENNLIQTSKNNSDEPISMGSFDTNMSIEDSTLASQENVIPIATGTPVKSETKNKKQSEQVKVDLNRLESIFDTIGEVVIFKNQIKGLLKKSDQNGDTTAVFDQMELVIKDLYDKALGLRMTTLQPLFQRMQRTLRDLSVQLDKNINVKVSGDETEIDRNLFEQLPDPLIHLIRNAIDHGIETKQERLESKKPPSATIEIRSYYESGQVIIEIKDDGRGIDPEKVFANAIQKNIIAFGSRIVDFTDEQINNFIFMPGFSTAAAVSDLSGRGVGLDVVKTTIEKFHGQIKVTSRKGHGSCFKLCLPLTTSLIDGITFQANDLKFIIPNNSILSIDILTPAHVNQSPNHEYYTNCFEKPYLCIDMAKYFNRQSQASWTTKVCIRTTINNQVYCFLFDKVISQCQVVVKPLPKGQQSTDYIGSAINDDGQVQLILDLSSVSKNYLNSAKQLPQYLKAA